MNIKNYIFIYINTLDIYGLATNIEFVAKHINCRAFRKSDIGIDGKVLIDYLNRMQPIPQKFQRLVERIEFEFVR